MNVPGIVLRTTHALTHLSLPQLCEVLLLALLQEGNRGTAIPMLLGGRD